MFLNTFCCLIVKLINAAIQACFGIQKISYLCGDLKKEIRRNISVLERIINEEHT